MSQPEFSRPVDRRQITAAPLRVEATAEERKKLAGRFGLVSVDRLEAEVELIPDGEAINARGRLWAEIVQSCAVSGDDLPARIEEPLSLRFVPDVPIEEEEIELEESQLDEIPYTGTVIDVGEAVAQTLALAIDPYAVGPNAEQARQEAGLGDQAASGPFAALATLKKKD